MSGGVNFDRAIEFYDATRGFPPGVETAIGSFLRQVTGLQPGSHILEIGIGTGRIALPLLHEGYRMSGIDISSGMMLRLRGKQGGERVGLAQADAHNLPFYANGFDAAIIVHVLHLVEEPESILRELKRVLKPDALLIHARTRHLASPTDFLARAWNTVRQQATDRLDWHEVDAVLPRTGWQQIGEDHNYDYYHSSTPADFLERIAGRQWSSTWHLPDEVIEQGVAAIEAAIDQHFEGDHQRELVQHSAFSVHIYRPPA